jgi:putative ABC transport system substrate-binding protein
MRRREVIGLLGTVGWWSFAAHAQQPSKMKRVALVHPSAKPDDMRIGGDPNSAIFFEEIKRLGYVEGTNLILNRYSAEGRLDRWPEIVRDVLATRPDVICVIGSMLKFFQSETHTIPIVAWVADPVAAGYISSLARPGGNITGYSGDGGPEYGAKRLQLFAEAVGKLSNVRVLALAISWQISPYVKPALEAAAKMNISYKLEPLQTPIDEAEYRRVFDKMQRDHVDGVVISTDPENYTNRVLLGRLARQYRLPAICGVPDTVEAGALMCYALDLKAGLRTLAAQIVEILNGGKPAEIPFVQGTSFEIVINLKAAKELGLELPAGLVARADRVIE